MSKQTLYLLRHAKADPWTPGVDDHGRELNDAGRDHMALLVEWMADHLALPELVLCSDSKRTRQTLAPILDAIPELVAKTQYRSRIYEATTGQLHAMAEDSFESWDRLMMVGHNPGFEYLALAVLRDEDSTGISKMPTGALAVIDFENGYATDAGIGVLRHWVTPKDLAHRG